MTDKEKRIEEIAKHCCFPCDMECNGECLEGKDPCKCYISIEVAKTLYDAGYRKQIEGEWTRIEVRGKNYAQVYYQHNDCKVNQTQMFPSPYNSCPNCGAKMKGGD